MGISHEYHSAPRRRTRGGIGGKLRLMGVIVAILLVAYAVTAILEKGTVEEESTPQTGTGGIAQNILAPLPMQGEAASGSGSEGAAGDSSTALKYFEESFRIVPTQSELITICDSIIGTDRALREQVFNRFAEVIDRFMREHTGVIPEEISKSAALISDLR